LLFEYLDLCLALRVECLDLGLKCLLTTLQLTFHLQLKDFTFWTGSKTMWLVVLTLCAILPADAICC